MTRWHNVLVLSSLIRLPSDTVPNIKKQYPADNRAFDDLDSLIGAWSKEDAAQFAATTAPFGQIDSRLWHLEPAVKPTQAQ